MMTFHDISYYDSNLVFILARHYDLNSKKIPSKYKNNQKIVITKKRYSQDPILVLKDYFTI